jgi:hypothetical protein
MYPMQMSHRRLSLWLGSSGPRLRRDGGAIALYRKCGFAIEGRHRSFICRDGKFVDAYSMARIVEHCV